MTNVHAPFTLTAKLKATGEVIDAAMDASRLDPQFVNCALEALDNGHFPTVALDTPIKLKF